MTSAARLLAAWLVLAGCNEARESLSLDVRAPAFVSGDLSGDGSGTIAFALLPDLGLGLQWERGTLRSLEKGERGCRTSVSFSSAFGQLAEVDGPNVSVRIGIASVLSPHTQSKSLTVELEKTVSRCMPDRPRPAPRRLLPRGAVPNAASRCTGDVEHHVEQPSELASVCAFKAEDGSSAWDGVVLDDLGRPTSVWLERITPNPPIDGDHLLHAAPAFYILKTLGHSLARPDRDVVATGPRRTIIHLEWFDDFARVARLWTEMDGQMRGPQLAFDFDGNITSVGGFTDGQQHGLWLFPLAMERGAGIRAELWDRGALIQAYGPEVTARGILL